MNEEIDSATEKDYVIKAIDRKTVHRICSGQVILSLAVAVKELIENSIDAGSTKIDVRLKEYGSEFVEVADDGCGVKKENFQALTLKHYTSKIREFSDLESIESLGFRGEALSSLCALSDLTVITRHKLAECATKLTYDHNCKIINEELTAREQGTTVILSKLFSTLPVRKKEFTKNLKRDFSKMCHLLYAYCLVCKQIRFTCTNQIGKNIGTVVKTEGTNTVRGNIISVFGTKQLSTLIDIEMTVPDDTVLKEYGLQLESRDSLQFSFELIISSVTHGHGRSTTDRQFCYVNSRPCELPKLMKLINEVYRQFNSNQYPFVYLNIFMQKNEVDVNVTPDKRQIFIAKEKLLLATIKTSLLNAFKVFPSTMKLQNIGIIKTNQIEHNNSLNTSLRGIKRNISEVKLGRIAELFKKRSKTDESFALTNEQHNEADNKTTAETVKCEEVLACTFKSSEKNVDHSKATISSTKTEYPSCKFESKEETKKQETTSINLSFKTRKNESMDVDETVTNNTSIAFDHKTKTAVKTITTIDVSLEKIRESLKKVDACSNSENVRVKFHAKISPDANENAEKELQRQISKDMFAQMSVVGQFNYGFIIAKLNNDLFIVDQHAADEKYNFEQLQATTVLERQVLVNPKPLQLTAANESILIENEEVFKKNGFTFKIDHHAECTKKVYLTGIPMSKNYIFGKDDIDEMLFMLQDTGSTTCRPSRLRSMFASRACRKSVMVGDALSQSDMRKLIDHMGEIEQPWNCPHGRPTIRHLVNLDLIDEN